LCVQINKTGDIHREIQNMNWYLWNKLKTTTTPNCHLPDIPEQILSNTIVEPDSPDRTKPTEPFTLFYQKICPDNSFSSTKHTNNFKSHESNQFTRSRIFQIKFLVIALKTGN